ncbi:MAG: NUDIX domain-containing protein [Gracilibacteraceae bacterium]|nr:NUDIX domain-containing protein [Gracilibacteraceae bacterium]
MTNYPLRDQNGLTEAAFLRQYDPNAFERLAVSVDTVVFSIDSRIQTENYRKLDEQKLTVLLLKRNEHPCLGKWSLPGGFVGEKETLDQAALRVLRDKTGLDDVYIEQLYTFGHPQRDPRMRIISVAYLALIDRSQYQLKNPDSQKITDLAWYEIDFPKNTPTLRLKGEAAGEMLEVGNSPPPALGSPLAFDHGSLILEGLLRLRNKIDYTDIVFNLLPGKFTITHLQQIYEIIGGEKLLAPVFRRKIARKITPTGEYTQERGHRPSQLYVYKDS